MCTKKPGFRDVTSEKADPKSHGTDFLALRLAVKGEAKSRMTLFQGTKIYWHQNALFKFLSIMTDAEHVIVGTLGEHLTFFASSQLKQ